jgi:septal ring factor EnvC (AmiA/AmiB activator)
MESLAQHIMYWVGQINALQKGIRRKNRKIARLNRVNAQLTADRDGYKAKSERLSKEVAFVMRERDDARKRADGFEAEVDGSHDSIIRQDDILTGVANALKGQPDDLMAHSHHDLAEVAQRVVGERDALV